MNLDASQELAVALMTSTPFCVVTGGPGTGKSTTLRVALDRMDQKGELYALASPTGKAAKRMAEVTGRPACTIHRLLAYGQGRPWGFDADCPLPFDAVIIDESSMLDVELCCALVSACRPETRIILVGDANQLPSVGPGRVLADLVESGSVPVARLTTVHRAAAESWVCTNAPKVLAEQPLDLATRHDFRFVEAESAAQVAEAVTKLVTGEFVGAQVLVPQHTTECGVAALNKALQQALNPSKGNADLEMKLGDKTFRNGDRVIQTVNAYKLDEGMGVFNGEVGTITACTSSMLTVDFGDRPVQYMKGEALGLELAYALTVHKSQGSEFPVVICVVHSSHTFMLTRPLFYTAITRAKKGVVIVGNRKGLEAALKGKDPPKRNTGLVTRMAELMGFSVGSSSAASSVAAIVERDVAPERQPALPGMAASKPDFKADNTNEGELRW
jgi:exodeoxyribonuclease V alpha subunit